MKYGHKWKQDIKQIHPKFQPFCINYKKWKKIIKCDTILDIHSIINVLDLECEQIEQIFIKKQCTKNVFSCLFPQSLTLEKQKQMFEFVNINKQSIQKLVKRINKIHKTSKMTIWYNDSLDKYTFLKSKRLSKLKINLGLIDLQCPICLDDMIEKSNRCILQCGHLLCKQCIRKIMGIECVIGTLENIVSSIPYQELIKYKCPMCRIRIQL